MLYSVFEMERCNGDDTEGKIRDRRDRRATDAAADDDDDADDDAVINARQELDKRIQDTPLPEPAAAAAADDAADDADDDEDAIEPPRYNEKDKLISFANKMCIRKKTMDDFIIMKPAPATSSANLPQIRDYHDEIAKRTNDY